MKNMDSAVSPSFYQGKCHVKGYEGRIWRIPEQDAENLSRNMVVCNIFLPNVVNILFPMDPSLPMYLQGLDQIRLRCLHVLSLLARKRLLIQECDPYLKREVAGLFWRAVAVECYIQD